VERASEGVLAVVKQVKIYDVATNYKIADVDIISRNRILELTFETDPLNILLKQINQPV
jgi:hypothetical protein